MRTLKAILHPHPFSEAGRFRPDLYYRLAVLRIPMPSLRSRVEDIPDLVEAILDVLGASEEDADRLRDPEWIARLQAAAWPGNVRELRNTIERSLVLRKTLAPDGAPRTARTSSPSIDLPYAEARRQALDAFEREYVTGVLQRHQGRVAEAARAAGVDRAYLYRLMKKL